MHSSIKRIDLIESLNVGRRLWRCEKWLSVFFVSRLLMVILVVVHYYLIHQTATRGSILTLSQQRQQQRRRQATCFINH